MSTFSDEPILVKPSARRDWRKWAVAAAALAITGAIVYIPINQSRLEAAAHDATRGQYGGVKVELVVDNAPHTLELTWKDGRFAPVLTPAPADGTTLTLDGRFGSETLSWNAAIGAFGPGQHPINPYAHYRLSIALRRDERVLWRDRVWAYGIHDTHGHSH